MTKKEARVLLANSYRTILQAYRHLLEPTFEVTGMVDGTGMLLESTETIKPNVAVLALTMRGINDVNTIRQLRNRNPNQIISNTGFESPCSTNGASCRFSPLWSNGPRLHGGNPIGFVPASRGGVYIESKFQKTLGIPLEDLQLFGL